MNEREAFAPSTDPPGGLKRGRKLKIQASADGPGTSVFLKIVQGNAAAHVQFRFMSPAAQVPTAIRLDRSEAQELLDQLCKCGLRPTEAQPLQFPRLMVMDDYFRQLSNPPPDPLYSVLTTFDVAPFTPR